MGRRLMDGIHLLGEWYGCPVDAPEMTRAEDLRRACVEAGIVKVPTPLEEAQRAWKRTTEEQRRGATSPECSGDC